MSNRNMLLVLYCLLFSILFVSCDKKQQIKCVSVKYFVHVFQTICSVSYEELQNAEAKIDTIEGLGKIIYKKNENGENQIDTIIYDGHYNLTGIEDTIISDSQVLLQIQRAISKLNVSSIKNSQEDVRIICTIEYQNGKKDYLDIDGKYADGLNFNGYPCKNDLELIYLIKKHIGYYSRMDESMYRVFYELADTCFKDTIINDRGQKYWRGKYPPLI